MRGLRQEKPDDRPTFLLKTSGHLSNNIVCELIGSTTSKLGKLKELSRKIDVNKLKHRSKDAEQEATRGIAVAPLNPLPSAEAPPALVDWAMSQRAFKLKSPGCSPKEEENKKTKTENMQGTKTRSKRKNQIQQISVTK